jgi:hypothetical protein
MIFKTIIKTFIIYLSIIKKILSILNWIDKNFLYQYISDLLPIFNDIFIAFLNLSIPSQSVTFFHRYFQGFT